jgi:hypothetical protein
VAKLIARRRLIGGLAAASFLAGCDASHPVMAFLEWMLRFNERFESFIFSPSRLAPESPENELTPEETRAAAIGKTRATTGSLASDRRRRED